MKIQDMKCHCHRPIIQRMSPYTPVLILIGKMAAWRITALCKRNVIRQVRVKHVELSLEYMEKFFNNGSMTMKFHILNVLGGLGGHVCVI